jgi:hypothetical protein
MTTDDELKRQAIGAALENECHCPAYALQQAITATLPYVSVINGAVVVTGGVTTGGTHWMATTGNEPRMQFDMSGDGRRDLPMSIGELVKELSMCRDWPGRWKAVGMPL